MKSLTNTEKTAIILGMYFCHTMYIRCHYFSYMRGI